MQLGNEVTNGLLWAEKDQDERAGGRLHPPESCPHRYWESDDQWVIVAELLNAGAAGVRAVLPRECLGPCAPVVPYAVVDSLIYVHRHELRGGSMELDTFIRLAEALRKREQDCPQP